MRGGYVTRLIRFVCTASGSHARVAVTVEAHAKTATLLITRSELFSTAPFIEDGIGHMQAR